VELEKKLKVLWELTEAGAMGYYIPLLSRSPFGGELLLSSEK
jgi:hypothetical protein